jgi:hypothetical protein
MGKTKPGSGNYYFEILKALSKNDIEYLVVGGVAVNLHNVQRMTNDIDVIINMSKDNIARFVNLMKKMGYIPQLPVNPILLSDTSVLDDWISNKNMKAFSFYNKGENFKVIDLVISQPLDFEKAYGRRVMKDIDGVAVSLVSIDDLIKMKLHSGRVLDMRDVEDLGVVKAIDSGKR